MPTSKAQHEDDEDEEEEPPDIVPRAVSRFARGFVNVTKIYQISRSSVSNVHLFTAD